MKMKSFPHDEKLVGYYCWAGPGTVRMIDTKYFDPNIDVESLMSSYDLQYLSEIKEKLGVTDVWATYSWGYNSQTEAEDYQFLVSRISNFHKLGMRLHAYVQGTNLVYAEYQDQDVWARDNFGRLMAYSKGRKLTCVNNPNFQAEFYRKVTQAAQENFDGIFIDNVHMGQMAPSFGAKPVSFVGCYCQYCQQLFKEQTGQKIPRFLTWAKPEILQAYLDFRAQSLHSFLKKAASITHSHGKLFGSNSYDPKFDPRIVYGFEYEKLAQFQDYLLFETHSFPNADGSTNNLRAEQYAQQLPIPVFALSYKNGISYDHQLSQSELELLKADADSHAFNLCIKGSEFVTDGVWHNLRLNEIKKIPELTDVTFNQKNKKSEKPIKLFSNKMQFSFKTKLLLGVLAPPLIAIVSNYLYGTLMNATMEKKRMRPLMRLMYKLVIR